MPPLWMTNISEHDLPSYNLSFLLCHILQINIATWSWDYGFKHFMKLKIISGKELPWIERSSIVCLILRMSQHRNLTGHAKKIYMASGFYVGVTKGKWKNSSHFVSLDSIAWVDILFWHATTTSSLLGESSYFI